MNDAPQSPDKTSPPPEAVKTRRRFTVEPVAAAVVLLAAITVWNWYDTRTELARTRDEVARRLRDAEGEARAGQVLARESRESARATDRQIAAIENRLAESVSQQQALETLYRELSQSRDESMLAEIEQTLAIASRELQLAGNIPAALIALQAADARLARADRPQFIALRKVIGQDIERLKAVPSPDIGSLTLKLDQLIDLVDSLPLLADGRPRVAPKPEAPPSTDWWHRFLATIGAEMKDLVRVQRIDLEQNPMLLSPDAAWFLRENVKLRLLHARIALLQRNEAAYRGDLRAVTTAISRYFDAHDKSVSGALASLSQLNAANVHVEVPSIAESLAMVRNFRAPRPAR